jgi:hypothetical protein
LAARPFVWGKFITFIFDVASDGRNEGDVPGRNDKGLVTYDRRVRKDAFFWYKANWSTEPFVYITGRRFDPRPSAIADIKIYSNLPSVHLVVNGRDLGTKTSDEHVFLWPAVVLQTGPNRVESVAQKAGVSYHDAVIWTVLEANDGGQADAGGSAVTLSGPCTTLVNDGPLVSSPSPSGPSPSMTGGPLVDGIYVLTALLNVSQPAGGLRAKLSISARGTSTELIQGLEGMPDSSAAGSIVTEGNLLVRTFSCPGPVTQVMQYTATPTTIQTLSPTGQVATYTKQ